MNKLIQIIILTFIFSYSYGNVWHFDNCYQHNDLKDSIDISEYVEIISDWLDYYNGYSIDLRNFKLNNENNLPNITAKLGKINISKDLYSPFYKFSPDNTLILDLTSYNILLEKNNKGDIIYSGAGPDSEVSIKDLENKIWKRILFVGTLYIIEDGFWINNEQFLIVGQIYNSEYNKVKPTIFYVDLKNNIIDTFEYSHWIKEMNCSYLERVRYKDIKKEE